MSEQPEVDAFMARVAYNKGIPTLYKFRACHDEATLGNLTRLLQGELWFSPLGEFNDPFEGRPRSVRAYADATEERAAFLDFAREVAEKDKMSEQEREKLLRQAEALSTHYATDIPTGFRESLANDCFVFSMSGSREHPLQWSHYGDQHKGVCVHLDATQFPIGTAMTVDYTADYPAVASPWVEKDSVRNYIQCALTKADWWSYEGEFRIVAMGLLDGRGEPAWMFGKRAVQCPPNVISGLTLGVRMRDPMRQTLVDWCTANRPDLRIEVASMDDVAYKLNFAPL